MPAASSLDTLPFLLKGGHHAIKIGLVDIHRLGDLRDRDTGLGLYYRERFSAALAATSASARASPTSLLGSRLRYRRRLACDFGGAPSHQRTTRSTTSNTRQGTSRRAVARATDPIKGRDGILQSRYSSSRGVASVFPSGDIPLESQVSMPSAKRAPL